MRFTLDIQHGWADFVVESGDTTLKWCASFLTDSIYDFVAATESAVRGQPGRVVFADEPGAFALDIEPLGDGALRLTLSRHPDFPAPMDAAGYPRGAAEVRLRTFAGAVVSAMNALHANLGDDGYSEAWRKKDPFPHERLARLRQALRG